MAKVSISGTVTRVVEADPDRGQHQRRVFVRPDSDQETTDELRWVDGSRRVATGEIIAADDDADVGEKVTIEVESSKPEEEAAAPAATVARRASRRQPSGGGAPTE